MMSCDSAALRNRSTLSAGSAHIEQSPFAISTRRHVAHRATTLGLFTPLFTIHNPLPAFILSRAARMARKLAAALRA